MRFIKRPGFIWLVVLVALPWPIDYWQQAVARRQHARDHELFRRYDCGYYAVTPCPAADFDGDGIPAELRIKTAATLARGNLSVVDGGREILRIPHANIDNTFRTHKAVSFATGPPRLVVYDGTSYQPKLAAVYAFDGSRLSEVEPTPLEEEILRAMAAYDDSGTLNARVFADLRRLLRFMAYYTLLVVLTCVLWWRGAGCSVRPRRARFRHPGGAK